MSEKIETIKQSEFDLISANLTRWSVKSKEVARLLFIEKQTVNEVAKRQGTSKQQVNVIKSRFIEKVKSHRVQSFMSNEVPEKQIVNLNNHNQEILTLHNRGYSSIQIVSYLNQNGVNVVADDVDNFIQRNSHESNRSS